MTESDRDRETVRVESWVGGGRGITVLTSLLAGTPTRYGMVVAVVAGAAAGDDAVVVVVLKLLLLSLIPLVATTMLVLLLLLLFVAASLFANDDDDEDDVATVVVPDAADDVGIVVVVVAVAGVVATSDVAVDVASNASLSIIRSQLSGPNYFRKPLLNCSHLRPPARKQTNKQITAG